MRLLFDENLSFRLVSKLADIYPGSAHVRDLGMTGAGDGVLWAYAAEHGYMLVSKDADFFQRSTMFGAPPKVLWLRVGNAPTSAIADLLRHRYLLVRHFHDNSGDALLPLALT